MIILNKDISAKATVKYHKRHMKTHTLGKTK